MPRTLPDLSRRTVTVETGRREVDLPVDGAGRLLRVRQDSDITVRASEDGSIGFKGHAAVFGQRTWIGSQRWGFWEQIEAGAFAKSIREKRGENNDVTLNRDHDNRLILARTSNGTLRLSEDEVGLLADADMGAYSYARDIETALQRRDLTGMSFAFGMVTYEWSVADDGEELLTHREVELFDVSIVGMPAYPQTDATLRFDVLAAARSAGFDAVDVARLAERLADPDDEVLDALRSLASVIPGPAQTTQDPSGPAEATRDTSEDPPAETTGTTRSELAQATLACATRLSNERF